MQPLPDHFIYTVKTTFTDGEAWLEQLPTLIAGCEQRWSIQVGPYFKLSYNFVAPATRADGSELVLKLGVPNKELSSEIAALRLCNGQGMVRLIEGDAERGILLMERVRPGKMLSELVTDYEQATHIAASVMRQMWRPVSEEYRSSLHSLERWTRGIYEIRQQFDGGTGPYPGWLVENAERIFAEQLATMDEEVLLHGDFHHDNLLSANEEASKWCIIDPKGLYGECSYEVGQFLLNPTFELAIDPEIQRRRIDILCAELGLDKQRVTRWAAAHAVLSSWWDYNGVDDGWKRGAAVAEVLARL
ncbi:MAG: aminoglycoside phosphotransferase family protein [Caldilineaceae bacterium]